MQRDDAGLFALARRALHARSRITFVIEKFLICAWDVTSGAGRMAPLRILLGQRAFQRLVMTTSRYSLGTTMVPSPARFMRTISACRSLCSSSCFAGSSAANAFSTGP